MDFEATLDKIPFSFIIIMRSCWRSLFSNQSERLPGNVAFHSCQHLDADPTLSFYGYENHHGPDSYSYLWKLQSYFELMSPEPRSTWELYISSLSPQACPGLSSICHVFSLFLAAQHMKSFLFRGSLPSYGHLHDGSQVSLEQKTCFPRLPGS